MRRLRSEPGATEGGRGLERLGLAQAPTLGGDKPALAELAETDWSATRAKLLQKIFLKIIIEQNHKYTILTIIVYN